MAVDLLSAVSHGVLSATGTNQVGINARFASWGLLTTAGVPSAEAALLHHLGIMNPLRRIVDAFKRIW